MTEKVNVGDLEHKIQKENNCFFVEVRELFNYYYDNLQHINLNNYTELSKTYQSSINKSDIETIKRYL